jgi:hypothetical protein
MGEFPRSLRASLTSHNFSICEKVTRRKLLGEQFFQGEAFSRLSSLTVTLWAVASWLFFRVASWLSIDLR